MIKKYYDYALAIMVFFLPLSMAIPNIMLIIATLLFLTFRKIENKKLIILSSLMVGYVIFKAIIFSYFTENLHYYKNYLLFFLLIVLFSSKYNKKLIKIAFVSGTLTATLISLFNIIVFYIKNNNIPLGNSKAVFDLLLIHRPYLGIMCFISIVMLSSFKLTNKKTSYFAILLLSFFLFLIVARLAILLLILFSIYKFFNTPNSKKKYILLIPVFIIAIFITSTKSIKERFFVEENSTNTIAKIIDYEPRFVIWKCLLNNNFFNNNNLFFGYKNINEIPKRLKLCYGETIQKKSKREYYLDVNFNTHNQFLHFFYLGGVILLLLFFIIIFYCLRSSITVEYKIIILSLLLFLLVENLFERQYGVYLLGVLLPLEMFKND